MGFVCFVKWKIPLGSTTFHWIPNKPTLSKSTAGDSVPVRVRSPAPITPIVNDTFTMGVIFVPVGLEPEVRVWPKHPCAASGRCSRGA